MLRRLITLTSALGLLVGMTATADAAAGWAIQPTPNPSSAEASFLESVSCPSATQCITVGYSINDAAHASAGEYSTLAEEWNGKTWAIQQMPSVYNALLNSVTCTSAASCVAVGTDAPKKQGWQTLAEYWNGTTWSVKTVPVPHHADTIGYGLGGVSCAAATDCTAIGYYNRLHVCSTLVEHWNGSAWSHEKTLSDTCYVSNVSCPATTMCMTVGDDQAEYWNGTIWKNEKLPIPPGTDGVSAFAVSCASTSNCIVTGLADTSSGFNSLSESWNGSTWTVQPTPNPAGATKTVLSGVSCASATMCIATGGANPEPGVLAEFWNGSTWTIQSISKLSKSSLIQVTCPSATHCVAVGIEGSLTLAEAWQGQ